jgi:hypothetical protein
LKIIIKNKDVIVIRELASNPLGLFSSLAN